MKNDKRYSLSKEVQASLSGKRNIRDLFIYVANLIEGDMSSYIDGVVKPSLGIDPGLQTKVSIEEGYIETIAKEEDGQQPVQPKPDDSGSTELKTATK